MALSVGGGGGDSVQYHNEVSPVGRGSKREKRSWKGQGGRTVVEEGLALVGKRGMRHWVRGKMRTLQGIRLDIALQRKVWRDGQNKGKGTHKGPGDRSKAVQG